MVACRDGAYRWAGRVEASVESWPAFIGGRLRDCEADCIGTLLPSFVGYRSSRHQTSQPDDHKNGGGQDT